MGSVDVHIVALALGWALSCQSNRFRALKRKGEFLKLLFFQPVCGGLLEVGTLPPVWFACVAVRVVSSEPAEA